MQMRPDLAGAPCMDRSQCLDGGGLGRDRIVDHVDRPHAMPLQYRLASRLRGNVGDADEVTRERLRPVEFGLGIDHDIEARRPGPFRNRMIRDSEQPRVDACWRRRSVQRGAAIAHACQDTKTS